MNFLFNFLKLDFNIIFDIINNILFSNIWVDSLCINGNNAKDILSEVVNNRNDINKKEEIIDMLVNRYLLKEYYVFQNYKEAKLFKVEYWYINFYELSLLFEKFLIWFEEFLICNQKLLYVYSDYINFLRNLWSSYQILVDRSVLNSTIIEEIHNNISLELLIDVQNESSRALYLYSLVENDLFYKSDDMFYKRDLLIQLFKNYFFYLKNNQYTAYVQLIQLYYAYPKLTFLSYGLDYNINVSQSKINQKLDMEFIVYKKTPINYGSFEYLDIGKKVKNVIERYDYKIPKEAKKIYNYNESKIYSTDFNEYKKINKVREKPVEQVKQNEWMESRLEQAISKSLEEKTEKKKTIEELLIEKEKPVELFQYSKDNLKEELVKLNNKYYYNNMSPVVKMLIKTNVPKEGNDYNFEWNNYIRGKKGTYESFKWPNWKIKHYNAKNKLRLGLGLPRLDPNCTKPVYDDYISKYPFLKIATSLVYNPDKIYYDAIISKKKYIKYFNELNYNKVNITNEKPWYEVYKNIELYKNAKETDKIEADEKAYNIIMSEIHKEEFKKLYPSNILKRNMWKKDILSYNSYRDYKNYKIYSKNVWKNVRFSNNFMNYMIEKHDNKLKAIDFRLGMDQEAQSKFSENPTWIDRLVRKGHLGNRRVKKVKYVKNLMDWRRFYHVNLCQEWVGAIEKERGVDGYLRLPRSSKYPQEIQDVSKNNIIKRLDTYYSAYDPCFELNTKNFLEKKYFYYLDNLKQENLNVKKESVSLENNKQLQWRKLHRKWNRIFDLSRIHWIHNHSLIWTASQEKIIPISNIKKYFPKDEENTTPMWLKSYYNDNRGLIKQYIPKYRWLGHLKEYLTTKHNNIYNQYVGKGYNEIILKNIYGDIDNHKINESKKYFVRKRTYNRIIGRANKQNKVNLNEYNMWKNTYFHKKPEEFIPITFEKNSEYKNLILHKFFDSKFLLFKVEFYGPESKSLVKDKLLKFLWNSVTPKKPIVPFPNVAGGEDEGFTHYYKIFGGYANWWHWHQDAIFIHGRRGAMGVSPYYHYKSLKFLRLYFVKGQETPYKFLNKDSVTMVYPRWKLWTYHEKYYIKPNFQFKALCKKDPTDIEHLRWSFRKKSRFIHKTEFHKMKVGYIMHGRKAVGFENLMFKKFLHSDDLWVKKHANYEKISNVKTRKSPYLEQEFHRGIKVMKFKTWYDYTGRRQFKRDFFEKKIVKDNRYVAKYRTYREGYEINELIPNTPTYEVIWGRDLLTPEGKIKPEFKNSLEGLSDVDKKKKIRKTVKDIKNLQDYFITYKDRKGGDDDVITKMIVGSEVKSPDGRLLPEYHQRITGLVNITKKEKYIDVYEKPKKVIDYYYTKKSSLFQKRKELKSKILNDIVDSNKSMYIKQDLNVNRYLEGRKNEGEGKRNNSKVIYYELKQKYPRLSIYNNKNKKVLNYWLALRQEYFSKNLIINTRNMYEKLFADLKKAIRLSWDVHQRSMNVLRGNIMQNYVIDFWMNKKKLSDAKYLVMGGNLTWDTFYTNIENTSSSITLNSITRDYNGRFRDIDVDWGLIKPSKLASKTRLPEHINIPIKRRYIQNLVDIYEQEEEPMLKYIGYHLKQLKIVEFLKYINEEIENIKIIYKISIEFMHQKELWDEVWNNVNEKWELLVDNYPKITNFIKKIKEYYGIRYIKYIRESGIERYCEQYFEEHYSKSFKNFSKDFSKDFNKYFSNFIIIVIFGILYSLVCIWLVTLIKSFMPKNLIYGSKMKSSDKIKIWKKVLQVLGLSAEKENNKNFFDIEHRYIYEWNNSYNLNPYEDTDKWTNKFFNRKLKKTKVYNKYDLKKKEILEKNYKVLYKKFLFEQNLEKWEENQKIRISPLDWAEKYRFYLSEGYALRSYIHSLIGLWKDKKYNHNRKFFWEDNINQGITNKHTKYYLEFYRPFETLAFFFKFIPKYFVVFTWGYWTRRWVGQVMYLRDTRLNARKLKEEAEKQYGWLDWYKEEMDISMDYAYKDYFLILLKLKEIKNNIFNNNIKERKDKKTRIIENIVLPALEFEKKEAMVNFMVDLEKLKEYRKYDKTNIKFVNKMKKPLTVTTKVLGAFNKYKPEIWELQKLKYKYREQAYIEKIKEIIELIEEQNNPTKPKDNTINEDDIKIYDIKDIEIARIKGFYEKKLREYNYENKIIDKDLDNEEDKYYEKIIEYSKEESDIIAEAFVIKREQNSFEENSFKKALKFHSRLEHRFYAFRVFTTMGGRFSYIWTLIVTIFLVWFDNLKRFRKNEETPLSILPKAFSDFSTYIYKLYWEYLIIKNKYKTFTKVGYNIFDILKFSFILTPILLYMLSLYIILILYIYIIDLNLKKLKIFIKIIFNNIIFIKLKFFLKDIINILDILFSNVETGYTIWDYIYNKIYILCGWIQRNIYFFKGAFNLGYKENKKVWEGLNKVKEYCVLKYKAYIERKKEEKKIWKYSKGFWKKKSFWIDLKNKYIGKKESIMTKISILIAICNVENKLKEIILKVRIFIKVYFKSLLFMFFGNLFKQKNIIEVPKAYKNLINWSYVNLKVKIKTFISISKNNIKQLGWIKLILLFIKHMFKLLKKPFIYIIYYQKRKLLNNYKIGVEGFRKNPMYLIIDFARLKKKKKKKKNGLRRKLHNILINRKITRILFKFASTRTLFEIFLIFKVQEVKTAKKNPAQDLFWKSWYWSVTKLKSEFLDWIIPIVDVIESSYRVFEYSKSPIPRNWTMFEKFYYLYHIVRFKKEFLDSRYLRNEKEISRDIIFYKKNKVRRKILRRYFLKGIINWVVYLLISKIVFSWIHKIKNEKVKSKILKHLKHDIPEFSGVVHLHEYIIQVIPHFWSLLIVYNIYYRSFLRYCFFPEETVYHDKDDLGWEQSEEFRWRLSVPNVYATELTYRGKKRIAIELNNYDIYTLLRYIDTVPYDPMLRWGLFLIEYGFCNEDFDTEGKKVWGDISISHMTTFDVEKNRYAYSIRSFNRYVDDKSFFSWIKKNAYERDRAEYYKEKMSELEEFLSEKNKKVLNKVLFERRYRKAQVLHRLLLKFEKGTVEDFENKEKREKEKDFFYHKKKELFEDLNLPQYLEWRAEYDSKVEDKYFSENELIDMVNYAYSMESFSMINGLGVDISYLLDTILIKTFDETLEDINYFIKISAWKILEKKLKKKKKKVINYKHLIMKPSFLIKFDEYKHRGDEVYMKDKEYYDLPKDKKNVSSYLKIVSKGWENMLHQYSQSFVSAAVGKRIYEKSNQQRLKEKIIRHKRLANSGRQFRQKFKNKGIVMTMFDIIGIDPDTSLEKDRVRREGFITEFEGKGKLDDSIRDDWIKEADLKILENKETTIRFYREIVKKELKWTTPKMNILYGHMENDDLAQFYERGNVTPIRYEDQIKYVLEAALFHKYEPPFHLNEVLWKWHKKLLTYRIKYKNIAKLSKNQKKKIKLNNKISIIGINNIRWSWTQWVGFNFYEDSKKEDEVLNKQVIILNERCDHYYTVLRAPLRLKLPVYLKVDYKPLNDFFKWKGLTSATDANFYFLSERVQGVLKNSLRWMSTQKMLEQKYGRKIRDLIYFIYARAGHFQSEEIKKQHAYVFKNFLENYYVFNKLYFLGLHEYTWDLMRYYDLWVEDEDMNFKEYFLLKQLEYIRHDPVLKEWEDTLKDLQHYRYHPGAYVYFHNKKHNKTLYIWYIIFIIIGIIWILKILFYNPGEYLAYLDMLLTPGLFIVSAWSLLKYLKELRNVKDSNELYLYKYHCTIPYSSTEIDYMTHKDFADTEEWMLFYYEEEGIERLFSEQKKWNLSSAPVLESEMVLIPTDIRWKNTRWWKEFTHLTNKNTYKTLRHTSIFIAGVIIYYLSDNWRIQSFRYRNVPWLWEYIRYDPKVIAEEEAKLRAQPKGQFAHLYSNIDLTKIAVRYEDKIWVFDSYIRLEEGGNLFTLDYINSYRKFQQAKLVELDYGYVWQKIINLPFTMEYKGKERPISGSYAEGQWIVLCKLLKKAEPDELLIATTTALEKYMNKGLNSNQLSIEDFNDLRYMLFKSGEWKTGIYIIDYILREWFHGSRQYLIGSLIDERHTRKYNPFTDFVKFRYQIKKEYNYDMAKNIYTDFLFDSINTSRRLVKIDEYNYLNQIDYGLRYHMGLDNLLENMGLKYIYRKFEKFILELRMMKLQRLNNINLTYFESGKSLDIHSLVSLTESQKHVYVIYYNFSKYKIRRLSFQIDSFNSFCEQYGNDWESWLKIWWVTVDGVSKSYEASVRNNLKSRYLGQRYNMVIQTYEKLIGRSINLKKYPWLDWDESSRIIENPNKVMDLLGQTDLMIDEYNDYFYYKKDYIDVLFKIREETKIFNQKCEKYIINMSKKVSIDDRYELLMHLWHEKKWTWMFIRDVKNMFFYDFEFIEFVSFIIKIIVNLFG